MHGVVWLFGVHGFGCRVGPSARTLLPCHSDDKALCIVLAHVLIRPVRITLTYRRAAATFFASTPNFPEAAFAQQPAQTTTGEPLP